MGDLLTPLQCPFCQAVFSGTQEEYRNHIDQHLDSRSPRK